MTPEQSKYFDDLDSVFGTVGWKVLLAELEQEIYEIQADALDAKDWDSVCRLRGRAEAWAYLRNLEAVLDHQKAELQGDENVIPSI
jgi:hypothetical protein